MKNPYEQLSAIDAVRMPTELICAAGFDSRVVCETQVTISSESMASFRMQRFVMARQVAQAIETLDFEVSSDPATLHPCRWDRSQDFEETYPLDEDGNERRDCIPCSGGSVYVLQNLVPVLEGDVMALHVLLREPIRFTVTGVGPKD